MRRPPSFSSCTPSTSVAPPSARRIPRVAGVTATCAICKRIVVTRPPTSATTSRMSRDHLANQRERVAAERELQQDVREGHQDERERRFDAATGHWRSSLTRHQREPLARAKAALRRRQAQLARDNATLDRSDALSRREQTTVDRERRNRSARVGGREPAG